MRVISAITFLLISISSFSQSLEKRLDSLIIRADYTEALRIINTQPSKSSLLQNKEAEALMGLGKLSDAEIVLSKIKDNDEFINSITKNNWGMLYMLKGRSDRAQEFLEQARDGLKQIGKDNTREAARCFSNLSFLFWSNEKLSEAEENGLLALQIRQAIFGNESEEVAASLNDLGLIYGKLDPDKGLEYYEKALGIYEKLYDKQHPKIAIANTNIGTMYFALELYGDAIVNFESAQAIWKKKYPEGHPNEALAFISLGRTYNKMKNTKTALNYYEKALSIYHQSYGEKHPDIASVYNLTGYIKLDDNKYLEALSDFQNALIANSPSFANSDPKNNPSIKDFYNGKVLLFSLSLKAQTLESLHFGKTLKLQDLKSALVALQLCDTLIDNIRHSSTNENDKIELGALANEVYEHGVRIAHEISELSIKPQPYREAAFYFAEKSKSAVLQESIADAQAKTFAGIPQELIEEEKKKKSTIAFLGQKLSEKPGPDEEKYLRAALFNSNLEYQQFIKKLETDYPSYYNLKFSSATPSVSEIQKVLVPGQAVVSYFVAEKSKKLYQFVITTEKFRAVVRSLPDNFDRACKGFINSLLYSDFKTYQNSQLLANLLRPAVPSSIKSIIVIPSGRIGSIPLEALPLSKISGEDFSSVAFFSNKWSISYEFAAGLLLQKRKKADYNSSDIFLCAPIHFTQNPNLADLPGTEKEVNAIAKLFTNAKVFIREEANETAVKSKEAQNYGFIHLATHGIVDSNDPALSEIFLNGNSADDGNLFCREIYNMNLGANLVVLSACETGLGKFTKGEGVIGLSRALTYAGAKNIMVSFWKVSDESTAEMMISFYKYLLADKNQDISAALQHAKLDLIKTGKYASPYYWAPFVLIGK